MDGEPCDDQRGDALTGLGNWRQAIPLLQRDLERGAASALVFCDLDHFANFNHRNGHSRGDELLRLVASVLRSVTEQAARHDERAAYRIGGEEFLILLSGSDLHEAEALAQEARRKIKELPTQSEGPFSARFAIAAWTDGQAPTFASLLDAAEDSLRRSPKRDAVVIISLER